MTQAEIEATLLQFEGLVYKTARQVVEGGVEMEFEDVAQLLRIKVWQAVQRFDETRVGTGSRTPRGKNARSPLERFVFGCMLNLHRDMLKRPRRYTASIDALRDDENNSAGASRTDRFDARYLSVTDDEADIDLPPELSPIERQVVALRLEGLHLFQIDRALGLSRAQRERVMASLRQKLAHLDPAGEQDSDASREPPNVAPRTTRVPASLAA